MNIKFLGTGAADWDVEASSDDINFRRFSSILIDDVLLIDAGPCVFDAAKTFRFDTSHISTVIQTHSHSDHFNENTMKKLAECGAKMVKVPAGSMVRIGKYSIWATAANHGTCKDAVHYLIDDGNSRLFYGLDGAWLLYDEVMRIKEKKVDLIVLDGTIGDQIGDYRIFEHNNLRMVELMKETLDGYADRFMISHLAKTLHSTHNEVAERMKPYGIEVAYDGLCIDI